MSSPATAEAMVFPIRRRRSRGLPHPALLLQSTAAPNEAVFVPSRHRRTPPMPQAAPLRTSGIVIVSSPTCTPASPAIPELPRTFDTDGLNLLLFGIQSFKIVHLVR
uniref:Uncharacterized protein n=1 Tax=Oryza glumipatula TaxID=40148 RepID=A0A0E0B679_9ORYZ